MRTTGRQTNVHRTRMPRDALAYNQVEGPSAKGIVRLDVAVSLRGHPCWRDCTPASSAGPGTGPVAGPMATRNSQMAPPAARGWTRLWRTRRRAGAGWAWKQEREGKDRICRRKRAGGEQEVQEEEDQERGGEQEGEEE